MSGLVENPTKRGENSLFLNKLYKMHKRKEGIMGSFALVLGIQIGYNVVTKVTTVAFVCHQFVKNLKQRSEDKWYAS